MALTAWLSAESRADRVWPATSPPVASLVGPDGDAARSSGAVARSGGAVLGRGDGRRSPVHG
ncbi:hypothetical protein [Micromonospora sp. DT233]|uniref:hypothetical protein n=1 Tax=Micromonospora sp. DT233 TaxID=3393432 RepID=UPI003CECA5CD